MLKKVLSLLLVLTLTLIPMTAYAAQTYVDQGFYGYEQSSSTSGFRQQTTTGEGDVLNPVLSVVIPMNLDFVIDPFGLDENGIDWQVSQTDMYALNYMNTNVLVDVALTAVATNGAQFVQSSNELDKTIDGRDSKKLVFGIVGATTGNVVLSTSGLDGTYWHGTKGVANIPVLTTTGITHATPSPYDPIETASMATVAYPTPGILAHKAFTYEAVPQLLDIFATTASAPTVYSAHIELALDKATGGNAANDPRQPQKNLDTAKGVSSFMFYADLNTQAHWTKGDVTVTGVYTLLPYKDSEFKKYGKSEDRVGFNVVDMTASGTGTVDAILAKGVAGALTGLSRAAVVADPLLIKLSNASGDVSTLKFGNTEYAKGTDWTYNVGTQILTVKRITGLATAVMTVTMANNDTYSINFSGVTD
jgi:hypothetical protein